MTKGPSGYDTVCLFRESTAFSCGWICVRLAIATELPEFNSYAIAKALVRY
jgi:hypothetical protein